MDFGFQRRAEFDIRALVLRAPGDPGGHRARKARSGWVRAKPRGEQPRVPAVSPTGLEPAMFGA